MELWETTLGRDLAEDAGGRAGDVVGELVAPGAGVALDPHRAHLNAGRLREVDGGWGNLDTPKELGGMVVPPST